MEIKHLFVRFESKELSDDGEFEGYGSTFGNVDLGGDVVEKGAFKRTIREHRKAGTMPSMFASHNIHEPIGEWLEMAEDDGGLFMKGRLWIDEPSVPKAVQHYRQMKSRGVSGLSIGYSTRKAKWDEQQKVRSLLDVDLFEVSPTPFPMNPKSVTTAVKSLLVDGELASKADFEALLRDAGLSRKQAKAFVSEGYGAIAPRDAEDEAKQILAFIQSITKSRKDLVR